MVSYKTRRMLWRVSVGMTLLAVLITLAEIAGETGIEGLTFSAALGFLFLVISMTVEVAIWVGRVVPRSLHRSPGKGGEA